MSKNLTFEQKWPNFGPKKGPKMAPIFCENKKFHLPFLNNKLSLNNKKSSTIWKEMAKNSPKPYNVTTSNVFLTQKWPKWPKQEFS